MKKLLALLALLWLGAPADAATYYVRTDGGTSTQCTGLADAAYPGSGTGQACAWAHPFWAIPPQSSADTVKIAGGDTLVIGPGSYMMGYGAPNTSSCSTADTAACYMKPIPGGPSALAPTRIVGKTWDTGCTNKPQLWATERASNTLQATNVNNVLIGCLEVTDRSSCIYRTPQTSTNCPESYPNGQYGVDGLRLYNITNLTLQDLNIHGLAYRGIIIGRITNFTMTRVRIAANSFVGLDGDYCGGGGCQSDFPGTNVWTGVVVEWNGCGETYPSKRPHGCRAQSQAGYGDGVGIASSAGTWTITDSVFRFNTSDGLDLLYLQTGAVVTMDRLWAEGNAGNQIKISGTTAKVTNSVLLGNCDFFIGKSFTWDGVDPCRGAGSPLAVTLRGTTAQAYIINNTVYCRGDTAALTGGLEVGGVSVFRNNVFVGPNGNGFFGQACAGIYEDGGNTTLDTQYNTQINLRNARNCGSTGQVCLTGQTNYGFTLMNDQRIIPTLPVGSAHRNTGTTHAQMPATDFYGNARPALGGVDRGAVEAQN